MDESSILNDDVPWKASHRESIALADESDNVISALQPSTMNLPPAVT
jgi:hypothetical protein